MKAFECKSGQKVMSFFLIDQLFGVALLQKFAMQYSPRTYKRVRIFKKIMQTNKFQLETMKIAPRNTYANSCSSFVQKVLDNL